MDAQTLSKHELFNQIESSIARMIHILKIRPRFQAPTIAAATATTTPPPTIVDPPPKPATPLVTRLPHPTSTSSVVQSPAPNIAPVPVLKPTSSHEHFAPPHHPLSNRQITPTTISTHVFSTPPCQQDNQNSQQDNESSREGVADEREWHLPWRPVVTAPNAVGRLEWHPPWASQRLGQVSSLRTRMF
ncbi:hypothetical protein Hanom_Chr16g01493361 [Helianthus anomalus]